MLQYVLAQVWGGDLYMITGHDHGNVGKISMMVSMLLQYVLAQVWGGDLYNE